MFKNFNIMLLHVFIPSNPWSTTVNNTNNVNYGQHCDTCSKKFRCWEEGLEEDYCMYVTLGLLESVMAKFLAVLEHLHWNLAHLKECISFQLSIFGEDLCVNLLELLPPKKSNNQAEGASDCGTYRGM